LICEGVTSLIKRWKNRRNRRKIIQKIPFKKGITDEETGLGKINSGSKIEAIDKWKIETMNGWRGTSPLLILGSPKRITQRVKH